MERARRPSPELVKPQTVYVKPGLPGLVLWIIILTGVLPAFIPIFIFAGPLLYKVYTSHFGSMPMVCGENDELEIDGKEFSGSGTVIVAELNCKLKIVDSKLSGDVALESKGNLELTVENSTLEGKDVGLKLDTNSKVSLTKGSVVKSPETAVTGTINVELNVDASSIEAGSHGIDLGTNGKVSLVHKSKVTSDGSAVTGEDNLETTLDGSTIDSKEIGVSGGSNTKLKLVRSAQIHGAKAAVRSGVNLRVSIENSAIRSEGTAVCAGSNAEFTGSHATLSGGVEALRLERKPNEFDLSDSNVRGAEVFDAESCGGAPIGQAVPAATPAALPMPLPLNLRRVGAPHAQAPLPNGVPAPAMPPFDGDAAARALDAAARSASATCRSSKGKPETAWVNPGFSADGVNRGAVLSSGDFRGTPEEACILGIFSKVRIPPFDPSTRPSGLGRPVNLK